MGEVDERAGKSFSVGSIAWKDAALRNVRESDDLVRLIDSRKRRERSSPPVSRSVLTDLCNRKVNRHGRTLRQTVNAVRETMIDVNFQLRSLNRLNCRLEKIKLDVDKSIRVNNMSSFVRNGRPTREKVRDSADLLLREEQQTLRELRRSVETKQWRLCGLENRLADFRKILTLYLDRKSKVLDLVPDSTLPSREAGKNLETFNGYESPPEVREVNDMIRDSLDLIDQAKTFRQEAETFAREVEDAKAQTSERVDKALQAKVKEAKSLQKELRSAIGRNRQLANRSIRTFHGNEHSWLELKGPESAKHLATHEKLDRPLMRLFHQRSVGSLPEIVGQAKSADALLRSLREQTNAMGRLKMAELRLQDDVMDKSQSMRVDRQVAVLRSRKHLV